MLKKIGFLVLSVVIVFSLEAQTFAFGVKGGMTVGIQKWESIQRDPLFKYHGVAYIESVPENNKFGLFAQLGYHIKGSAIRNFQVALTNGDVYRPPTQEFQFRNLSLAFGAKQKFDFGAYSKSYYALGLRADYTLSTNLNDFNEGRAFLAFLPSEFFVRNFNYGAYFGAGLEFPFSELVGGIIEFSISPDISFQYQQPPLSNVIDPYRIGQTINLPERKIVNVVLELTVGLRFLRIVEYID